MGNDIDVCSKDVDIDDRFQRIHGSPTESTLQLILRTYRGFVNNLCAPERVLYNENDCIDKQGNFETFHFSFPAKSQVKGPGGEVTNLKGCFWKNVHLKSSQAPPICIIYLHTNKRCLLDAMELFPLCKEIGGSLISFDLPGCGRSGGVLSKGIHLEIASVLKWAEDFLLPPLPASAQVSKHGKLEIIIWARGMSTAPGIEFCHDHQASCRKMKSSPAPPRPSSTLRCLILDTPFLSIEKIIEDYIEKLKKETTIPRVAYRFAADLVRKEVKKKSRIDPFDVNPISFAPSSNIPCRIITAMDDDYISPLHGETFVSNWGGSCSMTIFPGGHFGIRSEEVVLSTVPFINNTISTLRSRELHAISKFTTVAMPIVSPDDAATATHDPISQTQLEEID